MDKLELINKSINEIRTILGAECTPIEGLPAMVRALAEDPSKSGFTTSFVFSNEIGPARPTGGNLDTTTGLVADLDEGWYQTEPITKKRSASESSKIWMSFATFKPDGTRVTEWSTPMNLKGAQGSQGLPGDPGETGPAGPKGEKGTSASYRTVSAYTSTDTIDTPLTPYGGNWVFATNELFPPQSDDENEWFTNADIKDRKKYLWLSQATFNEVGDIVNSWCEPFRLTGEDGQDGVDGSLTEFIYRLLPDYETYKKLSNYLNISGNELYSDPKENDKVPAVNDDFNIGTVWTDRPKGITETLQVEVCCTRVRKGINENWGPWSDCVIWSKWGEDGMDGDGVEYIYLVTPAKTNEGKKIDADYVKTYLMPSRYEASKLDKYQEPGFCFNDDYGYEGFDWTDEPSDVGPDQPMEWVSTRKQHDDVWGEFSDPKLWATFSEDGAAYITSFVFKRAAANEDVPAPTGGSYDKPRPDDLDWHDSVPSDFPHLPVWMSTRTFKSGDLEWDSDWSKPQILSDSASFQVEYNSSEDTPSELQNFGKYNGNEAAWRKDHPGWGDDNEIMNPIWMATASCKNGVWSDWVVTRIKGEKGETGPSGSSVSINSKVETLDELYTAWNEFVTTGVWILDKDGTLDHGDGCYVVEAGELYVYNGGYLEGELTDFDTYWFHTKIEGEPGKSAYIYVGYSDGLGEDDEMWIDPGHPASYIGMWYTDRAWNEEELFKREHYSWTKWSGEDGWGFEQVFLLTHKDLPYHPNGYHCPLPVKEEGDNQVEYLPHHPFGEGAKPYVNPNPDSGENTWSDAPLSPTEEYPFCWVATRKVNGKEFGPWKGSFYEVDNSEKQAASLYSRYTVDGVSGVYVELSNDFAYIPIEDGKIDPDFLKGIAAGEIEPVKTIVRAYIGDEPVDTLKLNIEGEHVVVEGATVHLKLEEIDTTITEIPLKVTVGDRTYEKSWKLFYDAVGYNISADSIVLRRNNNTGKLFDEELDVAIVKWDGQLFRETGIPLFAKAFFDDGSDPQILSVEGGEITPSLGGKPSIDLTKINPWVSKIHLYVVEADENGNYSSDYKEIAFQDIGIVYDGKNTRTINLTNDLGIIPLEEDGTIDAQVPVVTTEIQFYEADERITEGVTYRIDPKIEGTLSVNSNGVVTVNPANFSSIEDVPNIIDCYAEYQNTTLCKKFRLNVTKNTYEVITDSDVLHRDPNTGILIDPDIKCTLKRWNVVKNKYELPSNVESLYVHAECRHLSDESCPEDSSVVENKALFNNLGDAVVNLAEEVNLASFRLYVSSEDTLAKAKNNWLTYEDITVIADGPKGEKGDGALHLELSNDFTMVPTNSDGVVDSTWDEEDDEGRDLAISTATLYVGVTEIAADKVGWQWSIVEGADKGTLEQETTNTCSVLTMEQDAITVRCTATYNGSSISKEMKVVKSKGNPVFKLIPSARLFTYDNDGNASPESITFKVSKWDGYSFSEINFIHVKDLSLTDSNGNYVSSISPTKTEQTVYLKYLNSLVDQETIGWVESGSKGTDALHLELSNDFTMVATDDKGNLSSEWDEDAGDPDKDWAVTEAQLFCGTQDVTSEASFTWTISPSGGGSRESNETGSRFSLTSMTKDSITVTCTANYNGGSISKDFNVVKSKGQAVYKLVPSASIFAYDKSGNPNPSTISIDVLKWTNGSYSKINAADEGLTLSASSLSAKKSSQTVTLKKGDVILDQETIGYIESGSDGVDGINALTSFVFTRSVGTPIKPNPDEGSWTNPKPGSSSKWKDSVPNGIEPLYMSMRTFKSDGAHDPEWSEPQLISDSSDIQYEFTKSSIDANYKPENLGNYDNISAWRIAESAKGISWHDSLSDPVFMAVAKYSNGKWGDWSVSRIKGETGGISEDQWDTINQSISDYAAKSVENSLGTVKDDLEEARAKLGSLLNTENVDLDDLLEAYAETHRLEETASAMDTLKGYFDNNGKLSESHLSQGAVANLVNAAAEGKELSAQYLAVLVQDVIQINADQINAGTIKAERIEANSIGVGKLDLTALLSGGQGGNNAINKILVGSYAESDMIDNNTIYIVI